jgi:hypothetical protein
MQGFITETHMDAAEAMFPGIRQLYAELGCKPRTFLELLWEYQARAERCVSSGSPRRARQGRRPGP